MTPVLPLLLALLTGGPPGARAAMHDVHLSHSRMVVDGATITVRIRVFHDDTEAALRAFAGRTDLRIVDGESQDSVFQRYYDAKVALKANGERLHARVIQSGRDAEMAESPMWWYLLEYRAPRPVRSIAILQELMFEQFRDQRNILSILKLPGQERHSLYFAVGDSKEMVLDFK